MSTQSSIQAQRRRAQIADVMKALAFGHKSGLCAVCRDWPSAWTDSGQQRATCGRDACMRQWIFPARWHDEPEGEPEDEPEV